MNNWVVYNIENYVAVEKSFIGYVFAFISFVTWKNNLSLAHKQDDVTKCKKYIDI
jgi:hypothetical protein